MAQNTPDNAEDAIKQMRKLLADWLDADNDSRRPVAKLMRLLDIVDSDVRSQATGGRLRPKGAKKDEARYTVENTSSGPMLTEGKSGEKSPPFRVPKAIYDLVAVVLAESEKPLRFEDVLAEVSKRAVAAPSDFMVRVVLRFFMAADPPLIVRAKSMYHPAKKASLISEADATWKSLAS